MRAFSAACGLCVNGAFMDCAGFYKQKGPGWPRPLSLLWCSGLLDRDLLALRGGLLGERELEHAIAKLRFGFGLVHLLRQREAAGELAVHALATHHTPDRR